MENLLIEKTVSTPMICFNADTGVLEIRGESYPENVAKFYTPVLEWMKEYLNAAEGSVVVRCDIPFFNSSTSKVLLMMLDMLEDSARIGKQVAVKWLCEQENEMAIECGNEFHEDLEYLPFDIELYE